jgi:hypothetical protein
VVTTLRQQPSPAKETILAFQIPETLQYNNSDLFQSPNAGANQMEGLTSFMTSGRLSLAKKKYADRAFFGPWFGVWEVAH